MVRASAVISFGASGGFWTRARSRTGSPFDGRGAEVGEGSQGESVRGAGGGDGPELSAMGTSTRRAGEALSSEPEPRSLRGSECVRSP